MGTPAQWYDPQQQTGTADLEQQGAASHQKLAEFLSRQQSAQQPNVNPQQVMQDGGSNPYAQAMATVSNVPTPQPLQPANNQQTAQNTRGSMIKNTLKNFLYYAAQSEMRHFGIPTDLDLAQVHSQIALRTAQTQLEQAKTTSLTTTADTPLGPMPKSTWDKLGPAYIQSQGRQNVQGLKNEGALDTQGLKNEGATNVATIRAQVQDRVAQANIALKQAIQDRNFDFATKKFAELERYRQAELGLQQGRMDMAREALDYRETGPTAQTKTAGQFAGTLTEKIPTLKAEIDRLSAAGKLGPIEGRWNDFLAGKVGNSDPEYNNLRVGLSLFASGTARAHTSRTGIEAINYFKGLLAQPGATAAQIKSGLDAAAPYLEGYKKAAEWTDPRQQAFQNGLNKARQGSNPRQPPMPTQSTGDPFASLGGKAR